MLAARSLIVPLLQGFCWFDDGLQSRLQALGWTDVTRPQSMVMANVVIGVHKPADIARSLGVSRQSIHATILQMVDKGMLRLDDDPEGRRGKIVVLTEMGQAMREDANRAMEALAAELRRRIGSRNVDNLIRAFEADWGDPPVNV